MRGAKVVFCREKNKYVKIQILGGGVISVYFVFKIKNGIVLIAARFESMSFVVNILACKSKIVNNRN